MPATSAQVKRKIDKVIKLDKPIIQPVVPEKKFNPDELTFALDIGTRTVVGIVGIQEQSKFKVLAAEVFEHKNRAMLDGQIHDIKQVAEVAKGVKEKLEKKLGVELTKVAIAAAGRVLKTCEVRIEREIDPAREIDQEIVSSIEVEGLQKAQLKLEAEMQKDDKTQFYCVGYSVINYYLNGFIISTLIGHKGTKVGADILATFLPHIVVDSLYTVMSKIGLEVVSLTLEPIAAINVTIPKDLRLLNLALVDIGAGTSDIALTRDGSVVAYAMAPVAGDEITEKLAQYYLIDFNTAEKIKIVLSTSKSNVTFTDILGKKYSIKPAEILDVIGPSVQYLADTVAQRILEYNHKSPNAVFLIGGGSQIPGLTEMIASTLKLPKERVVVRGTDIIQNVKFSGKKLTGPEAITPIGIAVTAQMQKGQDFLSVTINGKKVRLFNSRKLNVADALVLVGFNPRHLIGRSGNSLNIELNGVKKTIKGEYGKAAEIFVNGITSNLGTILKIGDDILVNPAEDGKDASASISDIVKLYEIDTKENRITINGLEVEEGYFLRDKDIIECIKIEDDKPEEVKDLDNQPLQSQSDSDPEVQMLQYGSINTAKTQVLPDKAIKLIINDKETLISGNKTQYIFVDIFNHIDFDLSRPQGNIILKLNGRPAAFADEVKTGDIIDIYWERAL